MFDIILFFFFLSKNFIVVSKETNLEKIVGNIVGKIQYREKIRKKKRVDRISITAKESYEIRYKRQVVVT